MNHDDSIVIAGAGAAGIAAAISSARSGSRVLLVERSSRLGGTVTQSLIHSIGGLFDSDGKLLNNGLSQELVKRLTEANPLVRMRRIGKLWTLTVSPEDFEKLMEQWISEEPGITLLRKSSVASVMMEDGKAANIEIESGMEKLSLRPKALIDATGNADIIRMIDSALVTDRPGSAAAGLIFVLRGFQEDALKFPKNVALTQTIKKAVMAGKLSPGCGMAWIDSGPGTDEAYIKLQLKEPDEEEALKVRDELLSFIKTFPGFQEASLQKTGRTGIRDGGRIKGAYLLTEGNVRELVKFDDPACRCCWPIEYWDRNKGVTVEYLEDGGYYEIPMRSLQVSGMKNVWAAGKCLSADTKAQASARVVGACWAMGDALGKKVSE